MSRQLEGFGEAAAAFALRAAAMELVLQGELKRVMHRIEKTAAAMVGDYQPAVGGFAAWAPLSDVTIRRKVSRGYDVPAPLKASGDMLASFTHSTNGLEGLAGATDDKARYHETGTSKMPPRPVWGPAAFNNREAIQRLLGAAVVAGISGNADRLSEDGGYRYRIRI